MSPFGRWSQVIDATLYLRWKDGVLIYGTKVSSRFQYSREDGDVGSVAARGDYAFYWLGVWQAVLINLFPTGAAGGYPSPSPVPLTVGFDVVGSRGDIARNRSAVLDPLDGQVAGPLGLDGKP
jgi:hypothetical protein